MQLPFLSMGALPPLGQAGTLGHEQSAESNADGTISSAQLLRTGSQLPYGIGATVIPVQQQGN